ncbi:hypothetical protein AAC387_Pa08g0332 [Persea americana]
MASTCNKLLKRTSLSSLSSAVKSKIRTPPLHGSPPSTSTVSGSRATSSAPPRRFSSISRCPAALGCVQSLLPLHSTIAAARLTSCLSSSSRNCHALTQGTLCRTSPGL